jgi:hypothetical protein
MTLHLHDYGPAGIGPGGAPINYAEVSQMLLSTPGLGASPHDFHALVDHGGPDPLRRLVRSGDTVVCTAGPHAHLYHYWREVSGLDFRIVRDARTTAWSPYLLQEWLAAPLLRERDLIVFPSEFARTFYRHAFGPAATANCFVRRAAFRSVGPFDARLKSGGDRQWCRRAIASGHRLGYEPSAVVTHAARGFQGLMLKARRLAGQEWSHARAVGAGALRAARVETAFYLARVRRLLDPRERLTVADRVAFFAVATILQAIRFAELLRLRLTGAAPEPR